MRVTLPYVQLVYRTITSALSWCYFFFFYDTATTEIYTLSLHDALPISGPMPSGTAASASTASSGRGWAPRDRKSTRLNSSHGSISYAVFCLKKKNKPVQQVLLEQKKQK